MKKRIIIIGFLTLLFLISPLQTFFHVQAKNSVKFWIQSDSDYKIKPKDSLYIRIVGASHPFDPETIVDDEGMIELPFIDKMRAADLTVSELKSEITSRLKKYLKDPKIEIRILRRSKN